MPWVTKDQIKRAREIDVLDYVLRYEADNIKRVGSGFRRKDHPSIEIKSGQWRWYSQGLYGKTALDYLTDVRGHGLVEAVCMLLGETPQDRSNKPISASLEKSTKSNKTPLQPIVPPKLESITTDRCHLSLPLRYKNNNRVIAYMQSREIDRDVILDCIKRGDLYESSYYHNAVFLGKDESGRTRFAAMRSITTNYRCDAKGSDKKYAFLLPPNNPDSTSVAVFEAAVDALSHQTLCKQGYILPYDGWRLSLGGISLEPLKHFLQQHPRINHCLACTDRDEVGEKAASNIEKILGITTEHAQPFIGVDWNDTLKSIKKTERIQNAEITHPLHNNEERS